MYEIVGIRRVDYVSKKTQKPVKGYEVHFLYDSPEGVEGYEGRMSDLVFVNDSVFTSSGIAVGSIARPVYNKFGRCEGFVEEI